MSSRLRRKPEAGPNTADTRTFELGAAGFESDDRSDSVDRPEADDLERSCRRTAMDLLARREHSRLELERKLAKRSHPAAVVTAVLDALEAEGLLAADRFVESFVRARAAKGQGPVRIVLELRARGVDDGETRLEGFDCDWTDLARAVRAKRFGRAPPGDFKARARQARFLEYRGFTGEQIEAALEIEPESD